MCLRPDCLIMTESITKHDRKKYLVIINRDWAHEVAVEVG